jgi:hypothetical protein
MMKSRPALEYFLFESRPSLKSSTWDVKKAGQPGKFYLGC